MIFPPAARATLGLGITQIVGWGTTFMMPSVLGRHIQDDLALPSEWVFAGITVMFGIGALCSPRVGRLLDRTGARLIMTAGSLLYAASIALLSQSQGPIGYFLCWAGMGVASGLALSTPANIALAQIAGARARQAIAMLAIIGGFASTLFWPLGGALVAEVGWRGTVLVYAAIHLLVCAPVHFAMLPNRPPIPATAATNTATSDAPARDEKYRFLLLSITLSCGAFVFTGLIVHLIEILRGLGHSPASALLLASMVGPAQVAIRVFELSFGHRYSIVHSALLSSAALPFGLALALVAGDNFGAALVVIVCYGIANGLKAVQRATLPLALFGRARFGATMGRLALPQGILSASAPVVLAAVLDRFGAAGALWLCLVFAAIALAAIMALARLVPTLR